MGIQRGSAIWLSLKKVEELFLSKLRWRIHTGNRILIGLDPIANKQCFYLPEDIISALHGLGIFTWDKIILDGGSLPHLEICRTNWIVGYSLFYLGCGHCVLTVMWDYVRGTIRPFILVHA